MSAIIRARSQILDTISRRCSRRFCSSPSTERSSVINNRLPTPEKRSRGRMFVRTLAVGSATVLFASSVYNVMDVEKTRERLQAWASYKADQDAPQLQKIKGHLISATMTVPDKLITVYLKMRRLFDARVNILPLKEDVFTLVLDLNETLVFTGWTGGDKGWRTVKRPGVDEFLDDLSQYYEIVVFSDQLAMYVDPVIKRLDPKHRITYKLSRSDMKYEKGKRYKDFLRLERDPAKMIYVTASAFDSTNLHPENTVQIQPWRGTPGDTGLVDLVPFLRYVAEAKPEDVRVILASYKDSGDIVKEHSRQVRSSSWWLWWY